jgi:hypothetical protein
MLNLEQHAAHTPGPWVPRRAGTFIEGEPGHEETHNYPAHVVVIDKTDKGLRRTRFVAECSGSGLPNDANARLIAAAPELLAALKEIMPDGWGENSTMDHMPGIKAARLAIAKAEGRNA